jgi:uncharacterized protein
VRRIGLLSDTHGTLDKRIFNFFENVDEIWHAGDIGDLATAQSLAGFRYFRAVTGNIDGLELRKTYPSDLRFLCEEVDVRMIHSGGYPGHYNSGIRRELAGHPPKLFICGHSHILKIIYDTNLDFLFLNPGAAGNFGFHKFRTALRFVIDKTEIREMEIWQSEKF